MSLLKKGITLFTIAALCSTSSLLHAGDYTYMGGCCYEECRTPPRLAPYIALSALALAAIIALALQHNHNHSQPITTVTPL